MHTISNTKLPTARKAAFTLCSNNYLARAMVAAESFLTHHPDYHFTLVLVDRINKELTYPSRTNLNVVEARQIVDNIDALAIQYNVIELNTAIKARCFTYFLDHTALSHILYLDPDILVLSRFSELEQLLASGEHNIILTPHACSPIDDGKYPSEVDLISFGIFNLGFLALVDTRNSRRFLEWWDARLMKYCYMRPEEGMFTDQLWVNYAPIYFDAVHILKNIGYNTANWNLYERNLTRAGSRYLVNGTQDLRFFHFSHYRYDNPYAISKYQNRHTVEEMPALRDLIDDYQARLVANNHEFVRTIACSYVQEPKQARRRNPLRSAVRRCREACRVLVGGSGDGHARTKGE